MTSPEERTSAEIGEQQAAAPRGHCWVALFAPAQKNGDEANDVGRNRSGVPSADNEALQSHWPTMGPFQVFKFVDGTRGFPVLLNGYKSAEGARRVSEVR